jgi:hypothetical protein
MVGILFITATVAGIVCFTILDPIRDDPDYLTKVSANENQVLVGMLFMIIMGVAGASIAIPMYPILKKHNETLALGAVGFRIIEGVLFIAYAIMTLALLTLSQEYAKAETPDASYYQTLGTLLLETSDWTFLIGQGLVFPLAALMYYYIFYQSKLIPQWLSGWGFIGAALEIADALFIIFGLYAESSLISSLLDVPIFLQEMVLAVWLIVKGFDSSVIASESAKTDILG